MQPLFTNVAPWEIRQADTREQFIDQSGHSRYLGKAKSVESTFCLSGREMPFGVGFDPGVNVKYRPGRPILLFTHFVFSAADSVATLKPPTTIILGQGITVAADGAGTQLSSAGARKAAAPSLPQSPAGR